MNTLVLLFALGQCPGGNCGGAVNVQPGRVEVRLGFAPIRRLFGGGQPIVVKQHRPTVKLIPGGWQK